MTQGQNPVPCANCGAPMEPQPDGRTFACHYCRTHVQVAIDGKQIARGMGLDLADIEKCLVQIANTLYQGFQEHTQIQGTPQRIERLELDLEPDRFIAARSGQHFVLEHKKVVRGIALKTHEQPLDVWIEGLCEALAKKANQNARAAWVLGRLKGGLTCRKGRFSAIVRSTKRRASRTSRRAVCLCARSAASTS